MKKETRQTKPLGRSTKEDNAGLSLLRPRLFEVIGDTYNYFNEIIQNTFKAMSPFLKRLIQKKFPAAKDMLILISASGTSLRLGFQNPFKNGLKPDLLGIKTDCTFWIPYKQ